MLNQFVEMTLQATSLQLQYSEKVSSSTVIIFTKFVFFLYSHPHIKRTICKRCDLLLVPGVTATVRVRGKVNRERGATQMCRCTHA